MSPRKVILCEDTYGKGFFKDLLNRLKSEGFVSTHLGVNVEMFYGPCNSKLGRQLKIMAYQKNCDFFIVFVDADGGNQAEVRERVDEHVPNHLRNVTCLIVFEYEIEEWLCFNFGIRINDKPSVILKHRLGYEKYRLRSYVRKLDLHRLMKCNTFHDFVNCLGA